MKFFIYARKSTEDDSRQVLSIAAQLDELRMLAGKERLDVAHEYLEAQTAKEPGRPVFNDRKKLRDGIYPNMPPPGYVNNRGRGRYTRRARDPFRGLIQCHHCGCAITADEQKGDSYYRSGKSADQKAAFRMRDGHGDEIRPELPPVRPVASVAEP